MKIAILDRDGVINQDSAQYIKSADEWQPIQGSISAIAQLSKAGYRVFVATNQSGLGRGLFNRDDLTAMHKKMCFLVEQEGGEIERIFFCPHAPNEGCDCRKPATGMLDQLEDYLGYAVTGATFIGDSIKDLELAIAKACKPVLVLTGNGQRSQQTLARGEPPKYESLESSSTKEADYSAKHHVEIEADIDIYPDLAAAVDCMLSHDTKSESSAI